MLKLQTWTGATAMMVPARRPQGVVEALALSHHLAEAGGDNRDVGEGGADDGDDAAAEVHVGACAQCPPNL